MKKKGTRVISIDPVHNDSAKFVNAQWIAPRPYTDTAMLIGIAHTLLTEKLHNQDFLNTYTVGFDKFEAYLMGQDDGIVKDANWAAEISGVDAETLRQLARDMAKNRTMIMGAGGSSVSITVSNSIGCS